MVSRYHFSLFLSLLLYLYAATASAAPRGNGATIESIRFDRDDAVERVTVMLNGRSVPTIFRLDGENPRIVCDFNRTGYAGNKNTLSFDGDVVQRVRIGMHQSPVMKTRLVIDLRQGIAFSVTHKVIDQAVVINISPRQVPLTGKEDPSKKAQPKEPDQEQQVSTPAPAAKAPGKERQASSPAPAPKEPTGEQKAAEAAKEEPATAEQQQIPAAPPAEQAAVQPAPAQEAQTAEEARKESPAPQPPKEDSAGTVSPEEEERENAEQADALPKQEKVVPAVLGVSYERGSSDKEMVLFKLNGFHPPVIFSSEKGDLLVVCEFLDAVLGEGVQPLIEPGGRFIDKIRVTSQDDPNKVRVVLELVDTYNYDLKQVFFKEDNRFVVLIGSLGEKK